MLYKISNANPKTWQDKKFVEAELINADGELFKVSAWAGEFDGKSEIDVELEKNAKGYWAMKKQPKASGGWYTAHKEAVMEKAVARKEQSIGKFQDDKEWSIMVSSTMRDAVQLAVAEYTINKQSLDKLDECVLRWRSWLLDNWNVDKTDVKPF